MRSSRAWLALIGLAAAFAAHPARAQTIDLTEICERYANQPFLIRDGKPVSLSCDQMKAFADGLTLQQSLGAMLSRRIAALGAINLDDQANELSQLGCRRAREPDVVNCNFNAQGMSIPFSLKPDADGYVTEMTFTLADITPLIMGSARTKLASNFGFTDTFVRFALDVVVAKDATFADPTTQISRIGSGIRVRVFNIPRSSAPRVRLG